jgi:uncharacterized protein YcaQ
MPWQLQYHPRMKKPHEITLRRARHVWLRCQRLDCPAPFGEGAPATVAAVRHLGYVQIDTIHVIERCHHHILFSRIPTYHREHLRHAQSTEKSVFEYWTHALSYVPTEDMRHFTRDMRLYGKDRDPWFGKVTDSDVRKVVSRIRRQGPLTIRDIDDDVLVEKDHAWASRKPSKRALQLAFFKGLVTVSRREGMLKTYELMSRHFGFERPRAAPLRQTHQYLLDRALRSQGIVSLDSICHLNPSAKPAISRLIQGRVRRGELVPVELAGAEKPPHWIAPALLDEPVELDSERVHILSPFDPLIIQRKRLRLFFGYEHRFEAYVPRSRRLFGYFACPVLIGDEVVAALDLKTDREHGRLLIQKWTWVGTGRPRRHARLIEAALGPFERFQLGR